MSRLYTVFYLTVLLLLLYAFFFFLTGKCDLAFGQKENFKGAILESGRPFQDDYCSQCKI